MSQIVKHYDLAKQHAQAGASYDADLPDGVRNGVNHEMERLEKFAPVEFAITKRYLKRYIAQNSTIADVGVGTGHYSELLAAHGCHVHMVDVASRLLEAALMRLSKAGYADQILSITHASATDLSFIPSQSCDAVLMLGPFYHLCQAEERRQAANEALRILRPGGLLFATAINRLTMLRWHFSDFTANILDNQQFLSTIAKTGDLTEHNAQTLPFWHMATIDEFRADFTAFQQITLIGVESFANMQEQKLLTLTPEQEESWLDLIEETGKTSDGIGISGHFLYIGQNR
jgi:S-adenosylmethionine-dependent methyltransferase